MDSYQESIQSQELVNMAGVPSGFQEEQLYATTPRPSHSKAPQGDQTGDASAVPSTAIFPKERIAKTERRQTPKTPEGVENGQPKTCYGRKKAKAISSEDLDDVKKLLELFSSEKAWGGGSLDVLDDAVVLLKAGAMVPLLSELKMRGLSLAISHLLNALTPLFDKWQKKKHLISQSHDAAKPQLGMPGEPRPTNPVQPRRKLHLRSRRQLTKLRRFHTEILSGLKDRGETDLIRQLHSKMVSKGPEPDVYSVNVILGAYCNDGQLGRAERLLLNLISKQHSRLLLRANNASFSGRWRLTPLGKEEAEGEEVDKVEMEIAEREELMGEEQDRPSVDLASLAIVLGSLARAGKWRQTEELMQKLHNFPGLAPDASIYNKVMAAQQGMGQWQRCIATVDAMLARNVAPNETSYSIALQALGMAGQSARADHLLASLRSVGSFKPSVKMYNKYIKGCRDGGHWDAATCALRWMAMDDVAPDVVTLNTLMGICRHDGQSAQVLELYGQMQAMGMQATSVTCLEIVTACAKAGLYQKAIAAFWSVRASGTTLDRRSYHAALVACAKGRMAEDTCKVWEDMASCGVEPDSKSFGLMIGALGKSGQLDRVHEVLAAMAAQGVQPQLETLNNLINVYAACGDVARASDAFSQIRRAGMEPDIVSFNTLLKACYRANQAWTAVSVFRQLLAAGLTPSYITYKIYLSALEAGWLGKEASKVYWQLVNERSLQGYRAAMFGAKVVGAFSFGGDLKGALEFYAQMLEAGVVPTVPTFLALLKGCELAGQWEEALRILDEFRRFLATPSPYAEAGTEDLPGAHPVGESNERGVEGGQKEPGVDAYQLVIGACAAGGNPLRGKGVLLEMKQRGVVPTSATYALVVRTLQLAGYNAEALEVYAQINLRMSRDPRDLVQLASPNRASPPSTW